MSLALLGLGTALPEHSIEQARAAEFAAGLNGLTPEQARLLPVLYRRSGVRRRASVLLARSPAGALEQSFFRPATNPQDRGPTTRDRMRIYAKEALPLGLAASRRAIERSGCELSTLTHLVTVSCSGFAAPGLDIGLVRGLGLRLTVERTHVGFMGCHGALNGLRVANALAGADPRARILLCAAELCSLHCQYGWDPEQVVANALFADGAAALIGAAEDSASPDAWRIAATGSCLFPASEEAMSWTIGDHGFTMTLSPRVPGLIQARLRPWLEAWLAERGLGLADVRSWAVHPGGPRILQSVEDALDLDRTAVAASREVLAECGNMSSPTLLFILERLIGWKAPRPCLALGFGPGLVAEGVLFV